MSQIYGESYEKLKNYEIGDIIAFAETVIGLEQSGKINFTVNMDRDEGLAVLFRDSIADYNKDNPFYSYSEWLLSWLVEQQEMLNEG